VVTCAFDAPGLEVTKIFRVPVALAIGTLWYVSGVVGRLKLDSALLQEFNFKDCLIIWGRL
jgi:hypothetical protein